MSEQWLAALLTAVGCARRFAHSTVRQWRLDRLVEFGEVVELVTSELVTNAVRATGITIERPRYVDLVGRELNVIAVRLRCIESSMFVEVWDTATEPPVLRRPTVDDERGRGLFLVAEVSKAWGYCYPATGGKLVWAELLVPG